MSLRERDPEIHALVEKELKRQQECIDLIASENYTPVEVLQATGSVLTNKYSEGYPGKRYYAGNEFIDQVENIAIDRAKRLFGVDHANVQPHSGSTANYCAYAAIMESGDTFMGMELSQGGHLTHGSPVNFSGKTYKVVSYAVDRKTEMLDYDTIKKQAMEQKPKVIVCGYTAYPRTVHFDRFREIADACGAFLLADISHIAGLIAGGSHVSPAKYADVITTTTHKTLRGPRGAIIMCKADFAQKIDKAVFPGAQGGPLDHVTAAKAVCFHNAMQQDFKDYAHQIVKNSKMLADELNSHGLRLVSGGTDNHMVLVDLTSLGITGKDAQTVLERAGIICNRNTIPYDTQKPFITSGIRLGTPAMTTRGMKESEMKEVAALIMKALKNKDNADTLASIQKDVLALCTRFPIYKDLRA
jgi:glycine hydroxymethyltransferase